MNKITFKIVKQDDGWVYEANGALSHTRAITTGNRRATEIRPRTQNRAPAVETREHDNRLAIAARPEHTIRAECPDETIQNLGSRR